MGGSLGVLGSQKVRLSVIVPVYNVAPYLRGCLDSIVAAVEKCVSEVRDTPEVEVICVDDGSTDGSGEIQDEYAKRYHFFVSRHLPSNKGVSVSRNTAIDLARGDWVAFVDADDEVSEDWFAHALGVIEVYQESDLVHFKTIVSIWDEKDRGEAVARAKREKVQSPSSYMGRHARERALNIFAREGWPVRNFIRRSCLAGVKFSDGLRIKEDVVFFLEVALRLKTMITTDFPGYFYTRREGSAVMRRRKDADSVAFGNALLELGRRYQAEDLWRAITVAQGYDFVQWADERDPSEPYDVEHCAIRDVWRRLLREGGDHLSEMYFWWRIAIRHWLKTGDLSWAHRIRRVREWMGRFI